MNTRLVKLIAVARHLFAVLGAVHRACRAGLYSREQARQVQEVQWASVESVRHVKIEGTKSPVGTGAARWSAVSLAAILARVRAAPSARFWCRGR